MLKYLKRLQATLDRVEQKQEETVSRISYLEVSLEGLRRDIAHGDEINASGAVRMDRLSERLNRIERGLELA